MEIHLSYSSSVSFHFIPTGCRIMFITLISTAVYETGIVMLDLLLLSSLIDDISTQYKHIASAGTKDGKSFCTLQVII